MFDSINGLLNTVSFLPPTDCLPSQLTSPPVISKPGNEPSISYGIDSLEENMSLLDPIFRKMSHRKRKAYFAKR
jgi:hypothetical protein